MIERVSISLPYSSTVVINLIFVSIKSLQLPDSCNETSTAQQGTFHCEQINHMYGSNYTTRIYLLVLLFLLSSFKCGSFQRCI